VHDLEVVRVEQERQLLGLVEADAVLPGHRPAEVDAGVEHLLVRLERARELRRDPLVVADHRVKVPVPGVEHVGHDEPVAGGDRLDLRHHGRQLRARDHRVLQHVVVRDAPDRPGRLLAALPEERALGVVPRDPHRQGAHVAADPGHRLGLYLDLGAGPVELDQEHRLRLGRVARVDARLDGPDDRLVHRLEGGRHDPSAMMADTAGRGDLDRLEGRDRGPHRLGARVSFTTTLVTMPSVPSEPTDDPARSYPGRSATGPPSVRISPPPVTTSRPRT
jgi:hypothetical protein